MTFTEALLYATRKLKAANIPDAPNDARRLLAHAAGVEVNRLILLGPDPIPEVAKIQLETGLARRIKREPVSHIIGYRDFYGRRFKITGAALDPRPETETLIETALTNPFERVLDLGLGSGAILLTLLAERPKSTGVGVDLSNDACALARKNAANFDLLPRVQIHCGNWFEPVKGKKFDLITANPPYIASNEMPQLEPELGYEPRMALTDEADGLSAYRTICAQAAAHLNDGGRLLFEIGPTQAMAVKSFLISAGFSAVNITKDLDGRDRVVAAQKT